MIGRVWRAQCSMDNAAAYEELLRGSILPELDDIDGCHGAYVLRRSIDDHVEFLVLHLFDSLDVVRSFAGDNYEAAVVPEAARELLASFDPIADHFDVRAEPTA